MKGGVAGSTISCYNNQGLMNNQAGSQYLTEELERYRGTNPELGELIDLYQEVFKIQELTRSKAKAAPGISFNEARRRLDRGQFILEGKAPAIDAGLFKETALALGEVFSRVSRRRFPIPELLALPQLKPKALGDFASDILTNRIDYLKQFARSTDYNEEAVFLFLYSLVVPFFQAEADNYQNIIKEASWIKGVCPFCGSPPRYARFLEEDGRLLLFCPLCRRQWRFPRLACPFCGNSDHKKLRHFHLGEDSAHRVDVCNKCRRYIKTTDERRLKRGAIPQVEEVVTLPLDYLAARQGYQRDA